jgi:hypothetical protein
MTPDASMQRVLTVKSVLKRNPRAASAHDDSRRSVSEKGPRLNNENEKATHPRRIAVRRRLCWEWFIDVT